MIQDPLNNAIKGTGPGSEAAFQKQLSDRMDGIYRAAQNLGIDLSKPLSPMQVNAMKKEVGDGIKWAGTPYEGEINQVMAKIYGNLNDAVDKAVPGTKALNRVYGNFQRANSALEMAIKRKMVSGVVPAGSLHSDIVTSILNHTIGSTPAVTGTQAAVRGAPALVRPAGVAAQTVAPMLNPDQQ